MLDPPYAELGPNPLLLSAPSTGVYLKGCNDRGSNSKWVVRCMALESLLVIPTLTALFQLCACECCFQLAGT